MGRAGCNRIGGNSPFLRSPFRADLFYPLGLEWIYSFCGRSGFPRSGVFSDHQPDMGIPSPFASFNRTLARIRVLQSFYLQLAICGVAGRTKPPASGICLGICNHLAGHFRDRGGAAALEMDSNPNVPAAWDHPELSDFFCGCWGGLFDPPAGRSGGGGPLSGGARLVGFYFFPGSHQPLVGGKIHFSGSGKGGPPDLVELTPLGLYLRMALGVLEFLGGGQVALYGPHSG